ncbi:MAG: hypothetical protein NTX29_15745 [Actinobacteria bacterium]|nr:hypothetical protein [Actinomycetota bacterium]
MTSFDSGSGRDPIDPDFAALFRPEDASPPEEPALDEAEEPDDEPHFEPIVDPVIDPRDEEAAEGVAVVVDAIDPEPAPEPAPVLPPDPIADTGRLFRSQGVSGHDETVLALASTHLGRLRTLDRQRDGEEAAVLVDAGPVDPASLDEHVIPPVVAPAEGKRAMSTSHRSRHITGGAVYIIVIGVTLLVGFANALLADGDIGWPTGLALLASSVYAALVVRREDDTVAMIVPPIAFLVVALTAGQLFLGSSAGSILNRGVVVFFTLADNWVWVIGATVAALAIVLVRRRRP